MENDLFIEQTTMMAPERTQRVTCRACDLPTEVSIIAPRLCPECAGDLDATMERVTGRTHAALWRAQDAWERLDADVAHADEATLARWHVYQLAVTNNDPRAAETERMVMGGIKGDFAALVRRWVAWKDALAQMGEAQKWAELARAEVEAMKEARR